MSQSLDQIALHTFRSRITQIFPTQIRDCLEALSEEQIWWRPNEASNSIGNLVLHLSGSLRHYLSHTLGGIEYERNRPAEFSERTPLTKADLLATFDETIQQASDLFAAFDTARFVEPTSESAYNPTVYSLLSNVALHIATHTGQIVYITKMLQEGAIDELWIRAHKAAK